MSLLSASIMKLGSKYDLPDTPPRKLKTFTEVMKVLKGVDYTKNALLILIH